MKIVQLQVEIDQSVEPKNVRQLGRGKTDDNIRSLKVEMHNVANKEMVMRKLKNSDDMFRKLRITGDYTQEGRFEGKKFCGKGKGKKPGRK